ncbi:MAG: hypothetical protein ACKONH_09385 [Planctomycetia bacterium]
MQERPPGHPSHPRGGPSGSLVVLGLFAVGLALAAFALAFQRWQTRRCLDFYGAGVARAITTAPVVELWRLAPGAGPGRLVAVGGCDVSRAAGLVHLRRGLVEDANFDWRPRAAARLEPGAWGEALVFRTAVGAAPAAVVVVGAGPAGGEMCVVGRTGRVGLGRLERGLRTWLADACPDPAVGAGN